MRDRNSTAIAVHVIRGSGTKPSDIHVAGGDLELANGERHGSVDSKLVLLVAVGEASRLRRQLIEPACRNRVPHVAGSHRQELCRSESGRQLVRLVCPIRRCRTRRQFEIDLLLHRGAQHHPGRGREERAASIACVRQRRWVHFLGSTRRGERNDTDHQSTSHQIPGKRCEPSHNHLHDVVIDATVTVRRTSLRGRGHASGDGNGDAGAMPREHARIGVFLCSRRANERVVSRGVCDHTRPPSRHARR